MSVARAIHEGSCARVESSDAKSTLGCEAEPILERRQLYCHAMPLRLGLIPTTRSIADTLGQHLIDQRTVDCLHTSRTIGHGGGGQIPVEMGEAGVVAEFGQLEVDVGVSQQLQLLDILYHFPGFGGNKGLHKSR